MKFCSNIMSGFTKINFLLAFSGHQLFTKNLWQQIFRYILLLLCFSRIISIAVIESIIFVNEIRSEGRLRLFHTSEMVFYVFTLWFHVTMVANRDGIESFVRNNLTESLNKLDERKLSRIAWRNFILFLFYCVLENVLYICDVEPCKWKVEHALLQVDPQYQNISTLISVGSQVAYVYESIVSVSWMALALALYNYCYAVKDQVMRKRFDELIRMISRSRGSRFKQITDRDRELAIVKSIIHTQESFDKAFQMLPFLTFALNLIQTAGYFFAPLMNLDNMGPMERIMNTVASFSFLIVPIAICLTACPSSETRVLAQKAVQLLEGGGMTCCDTRLVTLIEESINRKDSGWMFEVTTGTILEYAGQILSLAVSFMQLFH